MIRPLRTLYRSPRLRKPLWWLLVLSCLFTFTAFLGKHAWWLDLTSHFRLQYLLLQAVATGIFLVQRRWIQSVAVVCCLAINLSLVLPYYTSAPPTIHKTAQPIETTPLKVLHINLWKYNRQYNWVAGLIREKNADVVSLAEYEPHLQRGLKATHVFDTYPYQRHNGEIALFSRHPVEQITIVPGRQVRDETIVAQILVHKQPLTVVLAHTKTPMKPVFFRRQLEHFQRITGQLRQIKGKVLMVGDLNTTPWSHNFQWFLAQTGLRDSQKGFGIQPSWPTLLVVPWLPIDHCLVSEGIVVLRREVGPFIGSDHLPLYLELELRPPNKEKSHD